MNDIHDSFMADSLENTHDGLKAAHPEYLLPLTLPRLKTSWPATSA